jgi:hypothetical protein
MVHKMKRRMVPASCDPDMLVPGATRAEVMSSAGPVPPSACQR